MVVAKEHIIVFCGMERLVSKQRIRVGERQAQTIVFYNGRQTDIDSEFVVVVVDFRIEVGTTLVQFS